MDTSVKIQDICKAAIPFVMLRRKETGGFGATPLLPATIEDTYYALRILNIARKYNALEENRYDPAVDEQLQSYLETLRLTLTASARTIFQLLWCYRTVGLGFDQDAVKADIAARMQAYDYLDTWYYCTRILTEELGEKSFPFANKRNLAVILNRGWRSVDEAWMHMYLSRELHIALSKSETELIAWFQAAQNGDGGFGFFPGTTSFIENCYVCLRALTFLTAKPFYPERAVRFIRSCQTNSGGFGRSIRTTAFLDTTWQGLAALSIMNKKVVKTLFDFQK